MQRWIFGWLIMLLAGCGATPSSSATPATAADPTATPGNQRQLVASMELSGGMKQLSNKLVLWSDATLMMESTGGNVGPRSGAGRATPEQFDQLQKLIQSPEFQALKPTYMPANLCCDRATYMITVANGTEMRMITTVDGADWPAPLTELIQLLQTLQGQVLVRN